MNKQRDQGAQEIRRVLKHRERERESKKLTALVERVNRQLSDAERKNSSLRVA